MSGEQPLNVLGAANLALRFVLELCGIAAVGYWGFTVDLGTPWRFILGVGAPLALIAFWAFAVAPGADNPIPQLARMALGTAVLELAAVAVLASGQPALGGVYAVALIANALAMVMLGNEAVQ